MLASLEWLKQYVDINIPVDVLVDKITRAGLEVETVTYLGEGLEGVVTGKVTEIHRHPDSDHLWVCMMDYGQGIVQILTGAQNVKQNDMVPVAVVGSTLPPSSRNPEGMKLKAAKMRGLDSFGMLCSADELGIDNKLLLPEQRNGIFILPADTPIGVDVKEVLGLNDVVIDIDLTANRADCFSIIGLAREIAAITGCPLKMPAMDVAEAAGGNATDMAAIKIEAPELCPRFAVRVLKNIKITESPEWMQKRLRACGMRPISNVVDVTNYVMLELGQPMHAYDYDKVAGHTLVVRRGGEGEKLMTLDEQERTLDPSMITIGDLERAVGLGGVMGGFDTEVTGETVNVMLEAASFHGPSIRRTSRSLGLRSEASGRFERGVDTIKTHNALNRAAYLLEQMGACETVAGIVEAYPEEVKPAVITVTPKVISGRIGIDISKEEMIKTLTGLEFCVEEEGDALVITAPSWRNDVTCNADISEEIARVHGLDHIESHMPVLGMAQGRQFVVEDVKDTIQDYMVAVGMNEVMSYSFINPSAFDKLQLPADDSRRNAIELLNPITDEFKVMRTTMAPSVLSAAAYNLARQHSKVAIFEVGRVYLPKELPLKEFPTEPAMLCAVMSGKANDLNWSTSRDNVDFYDMKGVVEGLMAKLMLNDYKLVHYAVPYLHPGKSCAIEVDGKIIGWFGELHPLAQEAFGIPQEAYILEMEIEPLVAAAIAVPKYKHLAKYPSMSRDIAVVVPLEVTNAELEAVIREHAGELLIGVKVFDIYTGKQVAAGCKSMAFNLTYQAADRTLTDAEVDASMKKVIAEVGEAYKAQLRA
ncbi:MAG: phenylalanine--tRNA ligase subunit beta [Acidaminococcaceae bacterium]|nr:phenylalanine--tRNA ligase subunit beta [Acidaminococcaceae bacterium]